MRWNWVLILFCPHRGGIIWGKSTTQSTDIWVLTRGMADVDIMAIAECDQEFVDKVRKNI